MNVTFIRHSESVFNFDNNSKERDCIITNKGIDQAYKLKGHWKLIIVSPLIRTHQTLLFSNLTCDRVYVWNCVREQVTDECDLLPDEIFYNCETDEQLLSRGDLFICKLSSLDEQSIAVISHSEFIQSLTGKFLDNAESVDIFFPANVIENFQYQHIKVPPPEDFR